MSRYTVHGYSVFACFKAAAVIRKYPGFMRFNRPYPLPWIMTRKRPPLPPLEIIMRRRRARRRGRFVGIAMLKNLGVTLQ